MPDHLTIAAEQKAGGRADETITKDRSGNDQGDSEALRITDAEAVSGQNPLRERERSCGMLTARHLGPKA
jgi:hypothetical protein